MNAVAGAFVTLVVAGSIIGLASIAALAVGLFILVLWLFSDRNNWVVLIGAIIWMQVFADPWVALPIIAILIVLHFLLPRPASGDEDKADGQVKAIAHDRSA